jgi:hypothetical protein
MPRKTRMYLPDVPVHVVQRGNNRDACFFWRRRVPLLSGPPFAKVKVDSAWRCTPTC